ncbi:hypothetical protein D0Z07_5387 [Hyphodiscus hymeniophilus]|uniref:Uncharacterized protein n=1 Tax=Hyphodiscus hymeniophilus TaxID=353542 RepID=A0A9P6VIC2_9HELO|nr:hypothetical protein D0Z07_5387 [Hyphodiscus hymeniophilus]
MAMKTSKSWGLVVPGRPPTPSEGHAQIYARVGPAGTQRLVAFDNGTCLSFGPDDLVDEFTPYDAFAEQVAMVDKAVRDCQSVTQRYAPTGDDENRAYDSFRTQALDFSKIVRVLQPYGVHYQIPSKFASVSTVIPVYAQRRKNDIPGTAHPGSSVDTRFGITANPTHTDYKVMRRETDRDRVLGVRERDEEERQNNQSSGRHPGRGNRHIRRGRRHGRENTPLEDSHQLEPTNSAGTSNMLSSIRPSQSINPTGNQRPIQASTKQTTQNSSQRQQYGQARFPGQFALQTPRKMPAFATQYGNEFKLLSPLLPPPGPFDSDAIPPDAPPLAHYRHLEYQILANAREAGLEGRWLNAIPDGYRGNSKVSIRSELMNHYYSHGLDRYYESEDEFLEEYFREQRERFNEEYVRRTKEEKQARAAAYEIRGDWQMQGQVDSDDQIRNDRDMQGRVASYAQPHYQTAQQAGYELAQYADQLNKQPLHPESGRLRGDTFVGAPTLPIHVTTPNGKVLAAMAHHQALLHRDQNTQSIGSIARPASQVSMDFSHFGPNYTLSTEPSESDATADDNIQRGRSRPSGSARARAADERRAGSGGQYVSEPRQGVQMNTTVLAPSGVGIFGREPSPVLPRSRFFDQSSHSSPGRARLNVRHGSFDRSASAGHY